MSVVTRRYWDTKLTTRWLCILWLYWNISRPTFWRYRHIIQSVIYHCYMRRCGVDKMLLFIVAEISRDSQATLSKMVWL